MSFKFGATFKILGGLICSATLLAFACWPHLPVHSQRVNAAYVEYLKVPSAENKRAYEEALDGVNSKFLVLQYGVAVCGIAIPLLLLRKKRGSNQKVATSS